MDRTDKKQGYPVRLGRAFLSFGVILAANATMGIGVHSYGEASAKARTAASGARQGAVDDVGVGTSQSNKAVARSFIMAIPKGDGDAIRAVMSPDAVLSLRIAGIYSSKLQAFQNGTQWNREELIEMEQARVKATKGPITVKILSMINDGDHIAAEVISQGVRAATNRPYIQHYSYRLFIRHGKIVDARRYQDTFHEWDVWENPGISTAAFKPPSVASKATPLKLREVVTPEEVAANKAVIRRWANAVMMRDAEALRAELAPDMVWSFAMGGDYSPELRSFPGAYAMDREGMIKLQTGFSAKSREPFTFDMYSLVGEGDNVSAEFIGVHVGKDGHAYRQHYSIHFKLRDGKMVEGHVYQDTLHQFEVHVVRGEEPPILAPLYPPRRIVPAEKTSALTAAGRD